MKIACTHPGKIGDCLYALPTVKALCAKHGTICDFYTSDYCAPLKTLFEYQPYIDRFYVAPNYVIERMDMGVQPRQVPVDNSLYSAVYHLGFASVPDRSIPEFIALQAGVTSGAVHYAYPEQSNPLLPDTYIALAVRGKTDFNALFTGIVEQSPVSVVLVGGHGDSALVLEALSDAARAKVYDCCGLGFLDTTTILARAFAFVGLMSSQLVLANGFNMPKVSPHDGKSWDMRHVVTSPTNFYPINPTAAEVFEIIMRATGGIPRKEDAMRYCKTISESDYALSDTFQHIDNMRGILAGTRYGWGTEWRRWEYGMVLDALRRHGAKTVLEVGGGSSMFAAAAIWMERDVTVVDPDDYAGWFAEHSQRITKTIPFIRQDFFAYPVENQFDAVTAISVIEHVPDDEVFFRKLMQHVKPGGLLCLTTDFHPGGVALFGGHIRTYNAEMLLNLIGIAAENGFEVFGEAPDYGSFAPHVAGIYSFACMILRRKDG